MPKCIRVLSLCENLTGGVQRARRIDLGFRVRAIIRSLGNSRHDRWNLRSPTDRRRSNSRANTRRHPGSPGFCRVLFQLPAHGLHIVGYYRMRFVSAHHVRLEIPNGVQNRRGTRSTVRFANRTEWECRATCPTRTMQSVIVIVERMMRENINSVCFFFIKRHASPR